MKIIAVALALFVAACAMPFSKRPEVALAGVGLESISLFEQRYVLRLRVTNPNDADIPIDGLAFDVELNGVHFATGVSNRAVRVPRLGEALLEVSTTSNLGAFMRQMQVLQKGGRDGLAYRIKGNLQVSGYGALPFDHKGDVSIPEMVSFDKGVEKSPKPASKPANPNLLPGAI